jgi:hypothetical protein
MILSFDIQYSLFDILRLIKRPNLLASNPVGGRGIFFEDKIPCCSLPCRAAATPLYFSAGRLPYWQQQNLTPYFAF